jgi:predicted transcriptional regulator
MEKKAEAKIVITARVRKDVKNKISVIAKKEKRSISYIASRILNNYFGEFK